MVTRQLDGHTYVMPAVAEPYLGRFLDKSLFDVTTLNAARATDGRLPVRISYRGSTPAAPGLTITSSNGGTARGYLTPQSAATFGQALTTQWKADRKAGFPARTSLFTGITKISAEVAAPGTVRPSYVMHTLVIKTIGADGQPQPFGFLGLINVDDGRKYGGFVVAENGEARVSVPAGTYSAGGDDFTFDDAAGTSTVHFATVNEYQVTGAGQTLTLDYRKATLEPTVIVPRPADLRSYSFDWTRTDAPGNSSLGSGYFLDSSSRLFVAPAPPPAVGTVTTTFNWNLAQPGATPGYVYNVAAQDDEIPAQPQYRFTAARLATVNAAYYGENAPRTGGFLRFPLFGDSGGGGTYDPVARGTRRTEYVGAKGGRPVWLDMGLLNYDSWDDPGFIDGPERAYPAGSTATSTWFKGPLGAAVPVQPGSGYCFTCRFGNTISLGLVPFTDSDLTHLGTIFGAEDGIPVARFRFYRNGTLLSDQDDALGGSFDVPAGKADYRAVLDVDRRLQNPAQSTRSQTELTFASAPNTGPKLPADWYCDGDDCRVLPVVQARLALPLSLKGTLPNGKSSVTVTVAPVQLAAASPAASATLEIRAAGSGWSSVSLTPLGGGRYRGLVDNTGLAGTDVDVRFGGADQAGSTFRQTVIRAYTVAGS